MSKEQLLHIFDESACLTRRQMKDYVKGGMTNEESHAVEVHLNACPFCNDAIEGLFAQQEGEAVEMVTTLDSDFLKDHMGRNNPRIHLNSVTASQASAAYSHKRKKQNNVTVFWRNTSIAAIMLLAIGLLWFLKFGNDTKQGNEQLAQQMTQVEEGQMPVNVVVDKTPSQPEATNAGPQKELPSGSVAAVPATKATIAENESSNPARDNNAITAGVVAANNAEEAKEKKALAKDEVVVSNYKAPAASAPVDAERVGKMASRNTQNVAATAPVAYTGDSKAGITSPKNEDISYTIEGVSTRSASSVAKDNLTKADALFEKGEYEKALRVYKRELDGENIDFRQKAMIRAAECHSKLGDNVKAKELLQSIIKEGGPQKKAAKKLLKDIE